MLLKLQRGNVLEFGGSETEESSSGFEEFKDHNHNVKGEALVKSLSGW